MYLEKSNFKKFISFNNLSIFLVLFYILVRLPYLGFSNFNTDSFDWKSRIYNFGNGVFNFNLDNTVQKYHPGVTLLWIGTFSVKFFNLVYENFFVNMFSTDSADYIFSLNYYQILFLILAQSLLIFTLFYFLSSIYDPIKAFLMLLVLTIEPFFLGITTTLHLDGLLNLFLLNFLVTLYLSVKNTNRFYLNLSAIFFGFALLTKTTALLFAPVVLFIYLAKFYWEKKFNFIVFIKDIFIFSLTSFLIYYIFFPAMWFDALGTLKYIFKGVEIGTEDHYQLYFGNLVNDPGAFYYLIVTFIKATIYIFPALLVAAYTQLNTTYKKYTFEIFLFMSAILYLIEISIPAKKLDRYAFIFLILLSLIIYSYLYDFSKKLLIYFFGINLFFIFYLNFDYFSYYNPLVGGLKNGINYVEPKWAFGQKEVTDFFANEKKLNGYDDYLLTDKIQQIEINNNKMIVAIPEKYMVQLYPYFQLISSKAVINSFYGDASKAKYFIFPVWQDDSFSSDYINKFNLVYYNNVTVRGVPIFNVYKINGR